MLIVRRVQDMVAWVIVNALHSGSRGLGSSPGTNLLQQIFVTAHCLMLHCTVFQMRKSSWIGTLVKQWTVVSSFWAVLAHNENQLNIKNWQVLFYLISLGMYPFGVWFSYNFFFVCVCLCVCMCCQKNNVDNFKANNCKKLIHMTKNSCHKLIYLSPFLELDVYTILLRRNIILTLDAVQELEDYYCEDDRILRNQFD